ncbi:dienelactone hydrolase family protein [Lichenihabitans psoromatis]|uniref:dienelactone hydrolase family protein n=1 Tax=Lichenihabitans psoromatis TaxID=2528642 RepID=UPI0010385C83|nr:dienelactone hydrolase family protein [Lichenihabitans psoromatis]
MTSVSITRRAAVLTAVFSIMGKSSGSAASAPTLVTERLTLKGQPLELKRYGAASRGKRPTVLLLHGSKGLDANYQAYDRYACDLAGANIDTLLFTYFQPGELKAINEARNASSREVEYARSVDQWVSLVRSVASMAREHENSSGSVGLLGFSLGGFVGVAAASDPMFSVLTVFYAGLPTFYTRRIDHLPPLLDIHGDADRSVSLSQGSKLVETAKRLGGVADLAVFRNEGHGFDLDLSNRDAFNARQRAIAFTAQWLR